MEKKHICLIPAANSQRSDGRQATCLGFIEGKVLKVKPTPDKFDKTNEPCMKIRINKWYEKGEGREENKPYLIYYGLENPWGKNEPPKEGKTYWFWLHERKVIGNDKSDQKGWQWTHDWQLIENQNEK